MQQSDNDFQQNSSLILYLNIYLSCDLIFFINIEMKELNFFSNQLIDITAINAQLLRHYF